MGGSTVIFGGLNDGTPIELAQQTEVESLKSSVSEGKSLIASAITDKGVSTSNRATFQTMASNISKIATGGLLERIISYDISSRYVEISYNSKRTFSTSETRGFILNHGSPSNGFADLNIFDLINGYVYYISFSIAYSSSYINVERNNIRTEYRICSSGGGSAFITAFTSTSITVESRYSGCYLGIGY